MMHNLKEVLMGDHLNSWLATLAVLSPVWLPWLQDVSTIAALLLPIFGIAWFIIQGWSKIFKGK